MFSVGIAGSIECAGRMVDRARWIKSSADLAKIKLRGRTRVDTTFTLALAACNLIRLPKLLETSS